MTDLVFFDESHFVSDDLWYKYGWFQKSSAPIAYQQGIWKQQSVSLLLAIGWEGVVAYKLCVGGVRDSQFATFFYEADFKSNERKIFVLDNAPIHRSYYSESDVMTYLQRNRMVLFQSKYSPDLNPIEMVFGFTKKRVKQTEQGLQELRDVVEAAVKEISVEDCRNTIMKVFESTQL